MASGDLLAVFTPRGAGLPTSNPAVHAFATNNNHVLEYDPATSWSSFWVGVMPKTYAGGGITAKIVWAGAVTASGNVGWRGYFERDNASVNEASDGYASAQSSTFDAVVTADILIVSTIVFTNGAQINSLVVDDAYRFKIDRDAANGSDTYASRSRIYAAELRET